MRSYKLSPKTKTVQRGRPSTACYTADSSVGERPTPTVDVPPSEDSKTCESDMRNKARVPALCVARAPNGELGYRQKRNSVPLAPIQNK
jgi:hypothetical protein